MGGNVDDSRPPACGWVGGTLLGPEGAAREGWSSFWFRVRTRDTHRRRESGLMCLVVGSGFGGVFVNWIVDASI
jgi:hypothetical protein